MLDDAPSIVSTSTGSDCYSRPRVPAPKPSSPQSGGARPWLTRNDSRSRIDSGRGSVYTMQAFREPNPDSSAESISPSESDGRRGSEGSTLSTSTWDDASGEWRSIRSSTWDRPHRTDDRGRPPTADSRSSGGTSFTFSLDDRPVVPGLPSSCAPLSPEPESETSSLCTPVDRRSARTSSSSAGPPSREDGVSHGAVPAPGEVREAPRAARSQPDPRSSGLGAAEIRKLRKKGINPALYLEMKAARRGRSRWVGPLVGNTYTG